MKSHTPSTWIYATIVTLACALFVTVTGWLLASPSDEISRAVAGTGAANVQQATPDTFLDALASVLVAVDKNSSAPYLAAAVKMRPDLKSQITETVSDVYSPEDDADTDPDRRRVSRHRRRCTICHKGRTTLTLPCKAAQSHLEHHPQDYRGPCTPTPSPTPHHSPTPRR